MADITVDTATSGTGTTSTSYSHTIAADANLIIVCPQQRDGANAVQPVVSVTVGGLNCIFLVGVGTGTVRSEIWYLPNPPTGAQTVAATGGSGTDFMATLSISLKNAALNGTFNATKTAGPTTGTNADVDAVSSALGELVLSAIAANAAPTYSPDATSPTSTEQVERVNGAQISGAIYTEAGASGTVDMRVNLSASQSWVAAAVSIRNLIARAPNPTLQAVRRAAYY